MTTTHNLLHQSSLKEFKQFMVSRGWIEEDVKGQYEVVRFRHKNYKEPVMVFFRLDEKEHFTVFGIGVKMVRAFINHRNRQRAQEGRSHG